MTVPEAGVSLVLEPAAAKVAPRTDYEGKFSLQYSTAAMLVHGHVGLTTYTPTRRSPTRACSRSQRKVRYETRDYATYPAGVPRRRPDHGCATGARSRRTSRTSSARRRTR